MMPLCSKGFPGRRGIVLGTVLLGMGFAAGFTSLPGKARAQISPGPLAKPHLELEGSSHCNQCHSGDREEMDVNCLSCHTEINGLRRRGRGLHARVLDQDCASCHPDHAGEEFQLVFWEEGSEKDFDHTRAGWELSGRHAKVACRDCHKLEFHAVDFEMKRARPAESWLGLDTACLACHTDEHRGELDENCTSCHGFGAWKPADRFDHQVTVFPLTGKHVTAECVTCHPPVAENAAMPLGMEPAAARHRFKPLAHGECSDCHEDIHAGSLGPLCANCHVTTSFREVTEGFDHDATRYPLAGAHARLECASCHGEAAWGRKPLFATCGSCHQDAHAGQATLAGVAVDCASCHGVEKFRPATYSVAAHDSSAYPLVGRHREVMCGACHTVCEDPGLLASLGTSGVRMRPRFAVCRDCHTEAHGNQFLDRADAGACESCHDPEGFRPSRYTGEDHAILKLALEERHAEISCAACHGPERPGLPAVPDSTVTGSAGVWLTLESAACASCHLDPHESRFAKAEDGRVVRECRECHSHREFTPSAMDAAFHGELGFPLEGAHAATPCFLCHTEMERAASTGSLLLTGEVSRLVFGQTRSVCADCHQDPHSGQFAERLLGNECSSCHGVAGFQPATAFDHDRDARFALEKGHENVPCASCHPVDPEGVVTYRPLAMACETCHGATVPTVPSPQGSRP